MQRATNSIRLTQVSENNLKNIDVEIPYYKHTVIAGVSGSGKSTLAYDVIYATAQRKLLSCMSDGETIFSTKMKKPKVGNIDGLSTVISLKQICQDALCTKIKSGQVSFCSREQVPRL